MLDGQKMWKRGLLKVKRWRSEKAFKGGKVKKWKGEKMAAPLKVKGWKIEKVKRWLRLARLSTYLLVHWRRWKKGCATSLVNSLTCYLSMTSATVSANERVRFVGLITRNSSKSCPTCPTSPTNLTSLTSLTCPICLICLTRITRRARKDKLTPLA